MIMMRMIIGVRMLLIRPSALKHWIVAGISLGKTNGSPGIVIKLSWPQVPPDTVDDLASA